MTQNLDKTGWKRVAFGDVATASKEKCDPTDGSIDRYIAGEHMDSDNLRIERWGEVGDGYLGPAFHRRFRPGQVLYGSRRTYLRKVAVAEFDGVCANTTFVVNANPELLLPEFLPFVMTSEPFHAHAIAESKGSVNPYVNWSDLARFEFDLPPLDEQKRIAGLMWALERYARALSALTAMLDVVSPEPNPSVRLALLDHLLSGDEQGKPWPEEALGRRGVLTRGRRFTKADYVDEGVGCLHYAQIFTEFDLLASEPITFISESLGATMRFAQRGDLVVAGTSETVQDVCKAIAWMGDDVAVHDDAFVYRHDLDPLFASYLFASTRFQREKARFVSESKVVRVSAANLANIVVPVPPREEQVRIVKMLNAVEEAYDASAREAGAARSAVKSLLAEIFGGAV